MISPEEFETYIDSLISPEMNQKLNAELATISGCIDSINVVERARVATIKERISSTHKWMSATISDPSDGNRIQCYWCNDCNAICSEFEHINCLSIISKVKDNLPTYTAHNEYLMHTCSEILNVVTPGQTKHCYTCGIPERAKTNLCTTMVE